MLVCNKLLSTVAPMRCSAHTFEKQHSFFQAGHAYIVSSYCLNSLLSHDYKMLWGSKKAFYTPFMGISEMTDYLDIVILLGELWRDPLSRKLFLLSFPCESVCHLLRSLEIKRYLSST